MRVGGVHSDFENLRTSTCFGILQTVENGGDGTHANEDDKVDDDVEVCLLFDLTALRRRCTSVEHDFGVCAHVNGEADDPRRVPDRTTA